MLFHFIDIHHKNQMRMSESVLACAWANRPNKGNNDDSRPNEGNTDDNFKFNGTQSWR